MGYRIGRLDRIHGPTGSMGDEGGTGPAGQSWDAGAGAKDESVGATAGAAAVQVLEQLRDAIDDLAERASPTVREYSARIAELAAFTADRTAPFLKRAGEATAEASGKLAERSRTWAADIRASQGQRAAPRQPPRRRRPRARAESPSMEESDGRADADRAPAPRLPTSTDRAWADPSLYFPAMSVRPIVLLGDPRLRLKGKPVDSFGKYLHELLDDLAHTMRDAPGVGLAAPQLGRGACRPA